MFTEDRDDLVERATNKKKWSGDVLRLQQQFSAGNDENIEFILAERNAEGIEKKPE